MDSNVRPSSMERITTPALAQKFIDEQVKAVQEQVGDKGVLLALSGMLCVCALFIGVPVLRPFASFACLGGAIGMLLAKSYVLKRAPFFKKIG